MIINPTQINSKKYCEIPNKMLDVERMHVIRNLLIDSLLVDGNVVEFGCHDGNSSILLAKVLQENEIPSKQLFLYDSFMGMPSPSKNDIGTPLRRGNLYTPKTRLFNNFKQWELPCPFIIEGWFDAICEASIPKKICFAHLDGDLYQSILDSLSIVYPRLSIGAICVIDDYGWSKTPGVKIAVDFFMNGRDDVLNYCRQQAYFIKK
jgi:O-methyltransferase